MVLQRNAATPTAAKMSGAAPPVYRPLPVPRVLQTKMAQTQRDAVRLPAPAARPAVALRPTGGIIQRRVGDNAGHASKLQGMKVRMRSNGERGTITMVISEVDDSELERNPIYVARFPSGVRQFEGDDDDFDLEVPGGPPPVAAAMPAAAAAHAEVKVEPAPVAFDLFPIHGPVTEDQLVKLRGWIAAVKRTHGIATDRFDRDFGEAIKAASPMLKATRLNTLIGSLNKIVSPPEVEAPEPERRGGPKRERRSKAAESKEFVAPPTPLYEFTKGLQSICFVLKHGGWKQESSGKPLTHHAEADLAFQLISKWTADQNKLVGGKDPRWIGFTQNAAPCEDCCKFFISASKREKKFVAGFVFRVTDDQGGYRRHDMYAHCKQKKFFIITIIDGVMKIDGVTKTL
ncbi:MAG TPA: hypothetical protein VGD61_16975 [Pyrinomonadaceae bacterium]